MTNLTCDRLGCKSGFHVPTCILSDTELGMNDIQHALRMEMLIGAAFGCFWTIVLALFVLAIL